jgi:carboxylesterase type B
MQPAEGAENLLTLAEPGLLSYSVGMGAIPGRKYSEDCLGLNIWSKTNKTAQPKAVLIWLYGGGE